jgi:hypothetical protein
MELERELVKVNILAITVSGLLLLLAGLALYALRDDAARVLRFFLPIPPIAVAAYVYVFNMFRFYNAHLPAGGWPTVRELLLGTLVSTLIFGTFAAAMTVIIAVVKGRM